MDSDEGYDLWVHDSPYGHLHLRDLFAAFALAGLIANQGSPRAIGGPWLAAEAYHAADAMLAQRAEDAKRD